MPEFKNKEEYEKWKAEKAKKSQENLKAKEEQLIEKTGATVKLHASVHPKNHRNKSFLAIVVVLLTGLAIGIPGYVWYAKDIKPVDEAKEALKQELFDPSSAEFRNVRVTSLLDAVCGEVNAKNRMGGYVGFRHFQVITIGDKKSILLDSDTSHIAEQLCNL